MAKVVKRRYDSRRREEQARETRERIMRSALDLFVRNGYGRTTIGEIARAAGVAAETIYAAFGTKATLLRRTWYFAFRGYEADVPLFEQPEMQAILAEPDLAARTHAHARFTTANNRRIAPLLQALQGAAASEPSAEQMLAEYEERRLDVATKYAAAAASTGQLRISADECRDILFATMDGVLWQRLVGHRGWSDERYAEWLGELWLAQFVRRGEINSISARGTSKKRPFHGPV